MKALRVVVRRVLAENAEALGDGFTVSVAVALAGGRVRLDVEAALAQVLRRSGPGAVGLLRRILAQAEGARNRRAQGR